MFIKKDVIQTFRRAEASLQPKHFLAQEVGQRLLERLQWLQIKPQWAVDLSSGCGLKPQLTQFYPRATVVTADIIETASAKNVDTVTDLEQLAFASQSVDLLIMNLALPWSVDLAETIAECRRVLKPEGVFLFSTFGVDTLHELRESWAQLDAYPHVHSFLDMHDLGDLLLQQGFLHPLMDQEIITLRYGNFSKLRQELKDQGWQNIDSERRKTLTGKNRFLKFLQTYQTRYQVDNKLPATFEIIYGYAVGGEKNLGAPVRSETEISLSALRQALRRT